MRGWWVVGVALTGCGAPRTPADLERMAVSESGWEREQAVYAMTGAYQPRYQDELGARARDTDFSVRRAVYRNIGKTKEKEFLPLLEMLLPLAPMDDKPLIERAIKDLERAVP